MLEPIPKTTADNDKHWVNAIIQNWNLVVNQDLKYYSAADRPKAFWRVMFSGDPSVHNHWPKHFAFVGDTFFHRPHLFDGSAEHLSSQQGAYAILLRYPEPEY